MAGEINLAGRLNAVTVNGVIAGADQLYDDNMSEFQDIINQNMEEIINDAVSDINDSISNLEDQINSDISNAIQAAIEEINDNIESLKDSFNSMAKLQILSQDEYDALSNKDEDTLYVIKG